VFNPYAGKSWRGSFEKVIAPLMALFVAPSEMAGLFVWTGITQNRIPRGEGESVFRLIAMVLSNRKKSPKRIGFYQFVWLGLGWSNLAGVFLKTSPVRYGGDSCFRLCADDVRFEQNHRFSAAN